MSRAPKLEESYVILEYLGPSESGKTKRFNLTTIDGQVLGGVRWFGRWRCYALFPSPGTIFEKKCLRVIAGLLEEETKLLASLKRDARVPRDGAERETT